MFDEEKVAQYYDENKDIHERFAHKVSDLLKTFIDQKGIPYHSITYRVKTKESYIDKCGRKNYDNPTENITDLAGIRVIAYTTSDVDKICSVINEEFSIDEENSENKAELLSSDKVGYLSVHFVANLSPERLKLSEYKQYEGLKCEIQVRTLLQHAWAEIEHDRSYKFSGVLPMNIQRRFHLIAGVLEMMDSEFQRLSDEIDLHIENVRKETERGNLNIPIDTASLIEYISTKIDNPKFVKNFNSHDKQIINELNAFGIDSIDKLKPLFSDEFCQAVNKYIGSRDESNYLGLLRDAMICYNTKLYFAKAWDGKWTGYDSYAYNLWSECGADFSIIDKKLFQYGKASFK